MSNNILEKKKKSELIDEGWIVRLWEWADYNNISDYKYVKNDYIDDEEEGYFVGLPRNKDDLLNLTELDLSRNQFSEIPKEIGNLTNLNRLILSNNKLTELPKEIGNLINLTELDISNNKLIELPKEIGNLTNLVNLDFDYDQLVGFPEEIRNLPNLNAASSLRILLVENLDQYWESEF